MRLSLHNIDSLDFDKGGGLLPAIVQDTNTNQVLMLGYMSAEAARQTILTEKVTFFSRSKNRLWTKGETSGNYLALKSIVADCDIDTLLIKAEPHGPTCHTGAKTCFHEDELTAKPSFLSQLEDVIKDRLANPSEKSYTTKLSRKGIPKIAQKVGEEAVETVIEAVKQDKVHLIEESADLMYHLLVLWQNCGVSLEEVEAVLKARHT